jgi:membrane-bound lytic murein transglycosylase D
MNVIRCTIIWCLILITSAILRGGAVAAETPPRRDLPPGPVLLSCPRLAGPLTFCGEVVPLDNDEVRERLDREWQVFLGNQSQIVLWIKRSGRYMPIIEEELRKNGLPDDLKYLVIVESGLLPHAGSSAGAVGFWQFMKETGRAYGLAVNEVRDERRNIFTSTSAAAGYLKKLHGDFGSWTLAAAAYNMGEGGLQAEMLVQQVRDFYQLYLPLETQQYLPRIVVAKTILSDPGRYGFVLEKEDLYPPLSFERVELTCDEDIPLLLIARAANTTFKVIKDLNPELRGYYLAKGRCTILVPPGAGDGFTGRFEEVRTQWHRERQDHIYEARRGDTLSFVAARFNIPLQALLIWNRVDRAYKLTPGERLLVYPRDEKTTPSGEAEGR